MTENNPTEFPPPPDAANMSEVVEPTSVAAGTQPHHEMTPASAPAVPLSDDLLAILVCPLTRSPLRQEGDWLVASSPLDAGLRYPIRNGIPVLLVDEAALPDGVATLEDFKTRYADAIPG